MKLRLKALIGMACALVAMQCVAAVKIAFVGALSGPDAAAGQDQRDGFMLAVQQGHGTLGGMPVRVVNFDDGGRARNAARIAARVLAARVQIVTGLTNAEAAVALYDKLEGKNVLILSTGVGPAVLAADRCAADFFSLAPSEDVVHENAGTIAQGRRYSKAQLIVPPDMGRRVETAFRARFTGTVDVTVQPAGSGSMASHIDRIRVSTPGVVYVALRKDQTKAFLQAYDNAGLFHRIPVIVAQTEPGLVEALGRDFPGTTVSARWAPGMESDRSQTFVNAFKQRFGRVPSVYAVQGYDAASVLAEAFRSVKDKKINVDDIESSLVSRRFDGVGGSMRFASNGFATSDWQAWEIFGDAAGIPYLVAREPTLHEQADVHSGRCASK